MVVFEGCQNLARIDVEAKGDEFADTANVAEQSIALQIFDTFGLTFHDIEVARLVVGYIAADCNSLVLLQDVIADIVVADVRVFNGFEELEPTVELLCG